MITGTNPLGSGTVERATGMLKITAPAATGSAPGPDGGPA